MSLINELLNYNNSKSYTNNIDHWSTNPFFQVYPPTVLKPYTTYKYDISSCFNKFNKTEIIQKLEDTVIITLLMPGFDKSEIEIFVEDNILNIKANTTGDAQISKFASIEESYTYTIPKEYDGDKITANLKNGILTITIDKIETKKNTIEIK